MELDVETARASEGTIRFRRWVGALVGSAVVVVALLTAMESDAGRRAEQALVRASRLSLDLFGRIAASGAARSFQASGLQEALAIGATAEARTIASIDEPAVARGQRAVARVERRVSARLTETVERMTAAPGPRSGLDETTRTGITASVEELQALVLRQNEQVDTADRFGTRQERAMFALILTAIAAVLLGVAGLTGPSRAGRRALGVAAVALVAAVAWGASGLVF
ncbi:MAG TPA: hypothetical protein VHL78_06485 [Actinomycetota bacterium]|nr:hypothetical protein [Actinomycetota bacterium]